MSKKPTLRDVAKLADVSLSTVSQTLNNKPGVSTEMRQRILSAASELGYRPKIVVDGDRATDLKTIGLLTKRRNDDALVINPFYSYILAGAERECSRHNISMMYANVEVDESNHTLSLPAMILDDRVDGIIVVGAFVEETLSDISQSTSKDLVLVDAYTSLENTFDSVLIDNLRGAMTAVNYLIDNGHRRIGLVRSEPSSYPSILERREGYIMAMKLKGLEPLIENSALSREHAYLAAQRLVNRIPDLTAIFACNDDAAIGVLNALNDLGFSVPHDISVIGFDDIDVAQEVSPSLTTMHVDKVLMGVMAVRHLYDKALDPFRTPIKTLISTQLIERDSVRPIPE